MKIIQTEVIDSNLIDKSNSSKILLMDNLIEFFSPMFYEDLRKKQRQVESNENDVKKLDTIINKNKQILSKIDNEIKVEELRNKILKEIQHLSNIDVLYGKNKITVQNIIDSIDRHNLKNLEKRLGLLQKLVKQKKGI